MADTTMRTAILEAIENAPALDTGAPIELQFAVNLGAVCADAWLELKGAVRLHDYAAHQAAAFTRGLSGAMQEAGELDSHRLAVSREAFAAGLIGRMQQYLLAALGMVTRDERVTH